MNYCNRTWAEIDLGAAERNFREIKKRAGKRGIFAVVKANAYGHGALPLARLYESLGAEGFAVSNIGEALELREGGINGEILVLGYTPYEHTAELIEHDISQTVYSYEYALNLNDFAEKTGRSVKCHIKLDTGMHRLGFECTDGLSKEAADRLRACRTLGNLEYHGVFTHFATADGNSPEDKAFCEKQYNDFKKGVNELRELGYRFKYIHCDNSAGTLLRDDDITNAVRPGIVLYGYMPSTELDCDADLAPILSLRSAVSMIKTILPEDTVSYGRTYTADKSTVIATVPIGYADGYPRSLSGKGTVLIHGKEAKVVGRVCMDQMMIDISGIDNVQTGDVVTVIGRDGDRVITADDIAAADGTISYEILCGLAPRVERIYREK